jgi:hypothetical protein
MPVFLLALAACADRTVALGDGGAEPLDGAYPRLCDGPTDTPPSFQCSSRSPTCPAGPCPSLPLGSGGCEDVGSLFGYPKVSVDAGRPAGCVVLLPYDNPFYCGSPQTCTCDELLPDAGLNWICPL